MLVIGFLLLFLLLWLAENVATPDSKSKRVECGGNVFTIFALFRRTIVTSAVNKSLIDFDQ